MVARQATWALRTLESLFNPAQVWSAYSVLNVLYSLIQKSKINEFILAKQQAKSEAEVA
jgi:translation initiation factor 3 subunit L